MSLNDVTSQMSLFVSEGYVTRYDERGRAYRVIPMLKRNLKRSPETLLDTPITLPSGRPGALWRVRHAGAQYHRQSAHPVSSKKAVLNCSAA
jgi:multidrug efflux pump subunit AcrB